MRAFPLLKVGKMPWRHFVLDYPGAFPKRFSGMESAQRLQGRLVRPEELVWLRELIGGNEGWSRARIARELCEALDWRDGAGRLKNFAARSFLLKLEARGEIRLPPLRDNLSRGAWQWLPKAKAAVAEPPAFTAALESLRPLSIEVASAGEAHQRWSAYLAQYHYLGLRVVGENLGYLVRGRDGRDLACLLFGAAAWKCAPRDSFLEWKPQRRARDLCEIANNTRFLVLPWVRVSQLASHVLGAVARRIDSDWKKKYGHGLTWLETFVERERFRGTCYRAANWKLVGQTTGRSRQDRERKLQVGIKDVYLYRVGGWSK